MLQYHDPETRKEGFASFRNIIERIDAGQLTTSTMVAWNGKWLVATELEASGHQIEETIGFAAPQEEDTKEEEERLLEAKREWEKIDRELEQLRASMMLRPGIQARAKAKMIIDMRRGMSALQAAETHAAAFIIQAYSRPPENPPTENPPARKPQKSGCFSLLFLVPIGLIVGSIIGFLMLWAVVKLIAH